MADNKPFLYGGYYPGDKPVPKRYGANVPEIPDLSALDPTRDLVYLMDRNLNELDLPGKLVEFYKEDFFRSLRTSVSSGNNLSEEQISRYGRESFENLSGVGVSINLDPRKWAKDPKGMAWNTVKGFATGVLDLTDFENRTEAQVVYHLLSDESSRQADVAAKTWLGRTRAGNAMREVLFEPNAENRLINLLEREMTKDYQGDLPDQNPFSLDDKNGYYKKTKVAFVNFQKNSNNFIGRENSYDTALEESAKAMLRDMSDQVTLHRALRVSDDQVLEGRMRAQTLTYFDKVGFDQTLSEMIARGAPQGEINRRINSMVGVAAGSLGDVDSNLIRDQANRLLFQMQKDKTVDALSALRNDQAKQFAITTPTADFRDKYNFAGNKYNYKDWFDKEYQDELKATIRSKYGLAANADVDAQLAQVNSFFVQNELVKEFDLLQNGVTKEINGKTVKNVGSLKSVNSGLGKASVNKNPATGAIVRDAEILQANLENLMGSGGKYDYLMSQLPASQRAQYEKLLGEFRYGGRGRQGVSDSLSGNLKSLLGHAVSDGVDKDGNPKKKLDLGFSDIGKYSRRFKAVDSGGVFGTGLSGRDLFKSGAKNKILRSMSEDWWNYGDQAKVLGKMTTKGNTIMAVLPLFEEERAQGFWEEFFRQMEKGNLLNTFVLDRVKKRFEYFTPSYWVNKYRDKVLAGIGVNLTDKHVKTLKSGVDVSGSFFGMGALRLSDKDGFAKGAFANSFKVEFQVPGKGLQKVKVHGGKHFELVDSMKGNLLGAEGAFQFTDKQLKDLLMAKDGKEFSALLKGMNSGLKEEKLAAQFNEWKKWFKKNGRKMGISDAQLNDPEYMLGMFKSVHKRGVQLDKWGTSDVTGITVKYAGAMQKMHMNLNRMQTAIFDKYGKYITPFMNIKTRLANRLMASVALKRAIAILVSKLTVWLGAAFGAGVGGFLVKAIEPLIRFVVQKAIDFGANVLKHAIKGDLGGAFVELFISIDKAFNKAIQACILALAVPIGCFGIIMFFFMNLLSGFSPVNPSIVAGYANWDGPGIPGGDGGNAQPSRPCEEESIAPKACFFKDAAIITASSYNPNGGGPGTAESGQGPETSDGGGSGHGSNWYWGSAGDACVFNVPTLTTGFGTRGPNFSGSENNYCYGRSVAGPYYGYALDITTNGCNSVYFPNLAPTWDISPAGYATFGAMAVATGYNSSGQPSYKLVLLHLAPGYINTGSGHAAGDKASELADWGQRTHLHIELLRWQGGGWQVQKPETIVCN